ncbi:hypothetical protein B0H11DRAFT_2014764 [Mycena galericulata]|nr:hypothetical protein B0H11DRAFT_2014764 [Mycena galericulata]
MGTHGFWFYYHKGWYHVHYNRYDSYPEGLGIQVASQIPRWLEDLRESLDRDLEEAKRTGMLETEHVNRNYTQTAPLNGLYIEWMYEMDLDREIFLVYGHRACAPSTPVEHIYNWTTPPPTVEDAEIDNYPPRAELSIEELLFVTPTIERCEAASIAISEVIIGQMIKTWTVGHLVRRLEALPDRSHIPDELLAIGVDMVNATIEGTRTLITPDICLRISTHLDDERYRKKSILELVNLIVDHQQQHPNLKYGILFSFFHCVIIKVDSDGGFECTTALQFLPTFYAHSPSTPGITALVRLAYNHIATSLPNTDDTNNPLPPDHVLNRVPEDVWRNIAEHLGFDDLHNLPQCLPQLAAAAGSLLRYPYIGEYRILDVGKEADDGGTWVPSKENPRPNPALVSRTFSAMIDGKFVPALKIGVSESDAWSSPAHNYFFAPVGHEKKMIWYNEC